MERPERWREVCGGVCRRGGRVRLRSAESPGSLTHSGAGVGRAFCESGRQESQGGTLGAPPGFHRQINIPRQSRGFFIDGQSPLLLAARVTSRWYGLPAAKTCYLLPVNGLFRSFPSSTVRPPGLLPTGAGCTPQFFFRSSLLYPHSTLCTRTPYCDTCISTPDISHISSDCFSL